MCRTCTLDLADQFNIEIPLQANDRVLVSDGHYLGAQGHVVHTNGPTVGGVRRIQIRLDAGALVIVPETDLTAL